MKAITSLCVGSSWPCLLAAECNLLQIKFEATTHELLERANK